MKRVVSSSIITLFVFLAAIAAFLYFRNLKKSGGDPLSAIPSDVSFIIAGNINNGISESVLLPGIWTQLRKVPVFEKLNRQLAYLNKAIEDNDEFHDFNSGQPLIISAHVTGAGTFDFIFLKSLDNGFRETGVDELISTIAGKENAIVRRNYDGNMIRELTLADGNLFSYVIARELFIGSFTPFLVEDALRQLKMGKPVVTDANVVSSLHTSDSLTVAVNFSNLSNFAGLFMKPESVPGFPGIKAYGKWVVAEGRFSKQRISFSGYLTSSDTTAFVSCLAGQQPAEKKLLKILPRKTAVISYYGFSDQKQYYTNLSQKYLATHQPGQRKLLKSIRTNSKINVEEKILSWLGNEYALVITEPAGTSYDNNCFAVLKANDISKARKVLREIRVAVDKKSGNKTPEEDYNGHSIGLIRLPGVLPAMFGDVFSRVKKMYYTDIGGYIIFGNQPASIRSFIDEYESSRLLFPSENFKNDISGISANANHFFYVKPAHSQQIFKAAATASWNSFLDVHRDVLTGLSGFIFQVSQGENGVLAEVVQNFSSLPGEAGVARAFSISTDSSVSAKPLLTTDPAAGIRQVIFYDDAGNIYMADNSGNILWKQPIDGKILSEIFEIDLFRNNTRQFLFNTSEYIYLLDITGNPVGNYPIRLPAPATNGLVAFDFDKNRDFKIYVACNNKRIYAYLPSGKPLPGWNHPGTSDIIDRPLRRFSFSNREVLVIADRTGKLEIVNRYGERSVTPQSEIKLGMNSVISKTTVGNMLFTDVSGNIIELHPDGTVSVKTVPELPQEHGFVYSDVDEDGEEDFIFTDDREITVYDKDLMLIYRKTLEHAISGHVQIVTLKQGQAAMLVRSGEADKSWLLKPDGTTYPGFPVTGGAPGIVDELNLDGNKYLFVGGREKQITVYTVE